MATLTGQTVASSYEQLLHVDRDGGGNSTTHVSVKDGDNGTTFGFTIATDALMMSSTNRLEFGDTGTYINQSGDGVLNITSDTEVEINATTIDINGAVAMDGAITGGTNITISGELDAATLDISGNADIDGITNLDNTDIDGTLVVDGSNISLDSTSTLNIDNSNTSNGITIGTATSGVPISIGHTTSETTVNDNLTVTGDLTVNGTTTTINSTTLQIDDKLIELAHSPSGSEGADSAVDGGGIILKSSDSDKSILWENDDDSWHFNQGIVVGSAGSGHDVVFHSGTSGDNFTWDSSAEKLTITGTNGQTALDIADGNLVVADNIDLEGDIDVNGTANLDIVDIDGAVQLDSTLTIGADDQGYDVIFYGDTASSNMTWDTSEDDLVLNDATLKIDQDDNAYGLVIDSEATTEAAILLSDSKITTGTVMYVADNDALTTGKIANFHSASTSNGTRNLVEITNDHASATGTTALKIQQDSTGPAIVMNAAVGDRSSAPTLAFGDGDTGFYEGADDSLRISIAGTYEYLIDAYDIRSNTTSSFLLDKLASSASNPAFAFNGDPDTGVGRGGADTLNLITGGTSRMILDTNSRISLSNNDSGTSNTIFGKSAGASLDAGSNYNVFIGEAVSDASMDDALGNVAVGYSALSALEEGDYNVAVGHTALEALTDGSQNTAIGRRALNEHTTGNGNTAVGYAVMDETGGHAGNYNTAIGGYSMGGDWGGVSHNNVAIGYQSMADGAMNGADDNVVIGYQAGYVMTNPDDNVIIGSGAGVALTEAEQCVIIGKGAGAAITTNTAVGTTLVGYAAGAAITSGAGNVAVGYQAGAAITDGIKNIHIGYGAGDANVASNNLSIGYDSLGALADSGATQNLAIGNDALKVMNANCDNNVVIGHYAGDALNGAGAQNNVLIGTNTGSTDTNDLVDADNNVLIGHSVAASSATASNQIVLGSSAVGQGDNTVTLGHTTITDVYAASDKGAIVHAAEYKSYRDGNSYSFWAQNSDGTVESNNVMVELDYDSDDDGTGAYFVRMQDSGGEIGSIKVASASGVSFNTSSDYRLKENEVLITDGLDIVNNLKPYRFNFKGYQDRVIDGFFAHEVEPYVPTAVSGEKDAVMEDGSIQPQSMDYGQMVTVMVAAIQELSSKVEELEAKLK